MNCLTTGKISIMKKIIFILTIVSFASCVDQRETLYYNYTIVNHSGAEVNIVPYVDGVAAPELKKVLPNGQLINKQLKDEPPYDVPLHMSQLVFPEAALNYTDFEFTFNNLKRVIHKDAEKNQARNIFNNNFNNDRTEIYVITPEDYANAVDCGGNCN